MSLSPTQQSALEQLWAVTASDSQASRDRDERLLRDNGWDVERTVNLIFSGGGDAVSSPAASSSRSPRFSPMGVDDSAQSASYGPGQGRARALGAPKRAYSGNIGGLGLWGFVTFPVRLVMGVLTGTWYFIIRTFIPLSFLPHLPLFLRPPSRPTGSVTSRNLDPTAESVSFIRDLEQYTGASSQAGTLPDFYAGPYREFLIQVRKQGKVGLVILMCWEHEDDEEFKRDVLIDADLIRTLKENEVMVWAADIKSREGYQVSGTLAITTYPALTFVSLLPSSSTSNSTTSPKLTILNTLAGRPSTTTSASSIIQTLTTSILPRTSPFLARLKRERLTLEEARHLREEQDRAFREAERKDREKVQAARDAAALETANKERQQREEDDRKSLIEKRQLWRRYARRHLLQSSAGPIRVAMRTPLSPERTVRLFEPSASTTQLFIFAETLLIPPSDTLEDDPDTAPDGFEPHWDFRIVTAYPRVEVERVDSAGEVQWETVKKAGGALFAEKVEGSNWGDAEAKAMKGEDSDEEEVA